MVACKRCYDIGCAVCVDTYPTDFEVQVVQLRSSLDQKDFLYTVTREPFDQDESTA